MSRVRIARLFATVEACGATFRSTCRVSTPSPVWNEAGVVPLSDDWEGRRARVVMWDRTLSGRPVWVGRCDVPLVNLRANGNGDASWMDLNLVTRGGEGKGTTRAAGTVRVAMEVRTSAAGRDGSDGGDGRVESGDETVDETVAESAVDDANEDEDEDEDEVDAATRSAAGEATVSSTVSSKAATFSAALAGARPADEPAPRTPSTPTVTPTVSFATPIVVSAPSSTSSSLAASTASLRSKLVDAGRRGGRRGVSERLRLSRVRVRRLVCKRLFFVGANEGGIERRAEEGVHRPGALARLRVVGSDAAEAPGGDGSRRREGEPTPGCRRGQPDDGAGDSPPGDSPTGDSPPGARGSPVAGLTRRWPRAEERCREPTRSTRRGGLWRRRECSGERESERFGEDGSSRGAGRVEEAVERVRRVQNERRRRRGTRRRREVRLRAGVRSGRQRVCIVVAVTLLGFDLYPSRWGASPRVHGRSKALSKKASHCALTAS